MEKSKYNQNLNYRFFQHAKRYNAILEKKKKKKKKKKKQLQKKNKKKKNNNKKQNKYIHLGIHVKVNCYTCRGNYVEVDWLSS